MSLRPSGDGMKTLSGSCPKMNVADKETIAFASKKLPPKSSKTASPAVPVARLVAV
jgi:hypothetical protein